MLSLLKVKQQKARWISYNLAQKLADFHCPEMEVDQETIKTGDHPKSSSKGRIEKRRHHRKASIVFPKYSKGKRIGKSKGKK
jgi:hypothetical protein